MSKVLKPQQTVGIIGHGAYVPRYRLKGEEIARVWKGETQSSELPVKEKSVPGPDEDTVTMAIEAGQNALKRARIQPEEIRAVWVGSESHPYTVKPTSTIVAQALGITPSTSGADLEFACKAGTEALQAALGFVGSGMADFAMAIGMDTAQGRPGDALEYTAAAGGAAYIIGPEEHAVAVLEGSYSYVTDTPDFFRRSHQKYPEHGNRFTGEPAYFHHVISAATFLMNELGLSATDFSAAVFHQPNARFPRKAAEMLGFTPQQIKAGLLSPQIGNTYAGAALLGMTAILDEASPGDRVLMVSFGSGAGSDAFSFRVTENIKNVRHLSPTTQDYIRRKSYVDYATYARWRKKIVLY